MKSLKRLFLFLLLTALSLSFNGYSQIDIPKKPTKEMAVYDAANFLKENEVAQLRQKLETYADTTSTQIVIATINSLNGEYIGTYAAEWGQEWGIGQKDEDNGLLILISKTDSKIWITTGYGLEEYLTDATSKTIIESIILPEFRKAKYYEGLDKGTSAIFDVLAGNFDASQLKKSNGESTWPFSIFPILVFIVIFILIARKNKRNGGPGSGSNSGGPSLFDFLVLTSMGRSMGSGSFGGGSSGGFGGGGGFSGGFGGGSFGGGGAGGSW